MTFVTAKILSLYPDVGVLTKQPLVTCQTTIRTDICPPSPTPSIYLDAEEINNPDQINISVTSIDSIMDSESQNLNCE